MHSFDLLTSLCESDSTLPFSSFCKSNKILLSTENYNNHQVPITGLYVRPPPSLKLYTGRTILSERKIDFWTRNALNICNLITYFEIKTYSLKKKFIPFFISDKFEFCKTSFPFFHFPKSFYFPKHVMLCTFVTLLHILE